LTVDQLTYILSILLLVQGTLVDPVPGYIDSIVGFMGFGLGKLLGGMRVLNLGKPDFCLNYVPVDCAINSILAVCQQKLTNDSKSNVFNCVASPAALGSFSE
jgi:hypothetical protein